MIDNSILISTNPTINQNTQNDSGIRKVQQNLILMGFDIVMINKIISLYKIRTENEALDYLIKTDDGKWNHPFIPKQINPEDNNSILEQPKVMMNNMITKINSLNIQNSIGQIPQMPEIQISNIGKNNTLDTDEVKIDEDICEVCGESKEFHKIKEYNAPFEDNNNIYNNNIIFDPNNSNNLNNSIEEENNLLLNNNEEESNIIKNDQIENEEEENINQNECLICMGELENPAEIEKCKHKFCQECFNSYLINLININKIDKIPCPKNKCSNKELSEDFFSNFLTEQEYFKYRQFRAQNEIARDSKKIFCPLCDSYASIEEGTIEQYDSNNPNYKKSTLKCQKGHDFCSCGRPLHENDCYHDEKEFKDFLTNEKIKKCPKCGFLIKKNRGCNHMTCGNPICRYEFCWLCMKEAVPNHFDYGPCAGKQFFDPDSFSYKLQRSFPCLYCIYALFRCIFASIFFILGILILPGIGLSYICYGLIFDSDVISIFLRKKYLKSFLFIICICISFCVESIIYMIWALIISVLGLFIGIMILTYFIKILRIILYLLFCCCCCYKSENKNNNNISTSALELSDNINEVDENRNKV